MYRIYISHPSRVWRNTSHYSLLSSLLHGISLPLATTAAMAGWPPAPPSLPPFAAAVLFPAAAAGPMAGRPPALPLSSFPPLPAVGRCPAAPAPCAASGVAGASSGACLFRAQIRCAGRVVAGRRPLFFCSMVAGCTGRCCCAGAADARVAGPARRAAAGSRGLGRAAARSAAWDVPPRGSRVRPRRCCCAGAAAARMAGPARRRRSGSRGRPCRCC